MPTLKISPDLEMFYQIDDFTDPWTTPETILMLHGNSESSAAWYGWVPTLARRYRVVRPDMRGFGSSTVMPREFPWSLDVIISDYLKLMDTLGIARFHLVGAKIGGIISQAFAARNPDRVSTLTLVGTPKPTRPPAPPMTDEFEQHGVVHWAARTMRARLGSAFPQAGIDWWTQFMGRTATSSQVGFMQVIPFSDVRADGAKIKCPTLVIAGEDSRLASVDETRQWQQRIPNSRLFVIQDDSYHVAVSAAERCAEETLKFISG